MYFTKFHIIRKRFYIRQFTGFKKDFCFNSSSPQSIYCRRKFKFHRIDIFSDRMTILTNPQRKIWPKQTRILWVSCHFSNNYSSQSRFLQILYQSGIDSQTIIEHKICQIKILWICHNFFCMKKCVHIRIYSI